MVFNVRVQRKREKNSLRSFCSSLFDKTKSHLCVFCVHCADCGASREIRHKKYSLWVFVENRWIKKKQHFFLVFSVFNRFCYLSVSKFPSFCVSVGNQKFNRIKNVNVLLSYTQIPSTYTTRFNPFVWISVDHLSPLRFFLLSVFKVAFHLSFATQKINRRFIILLR